MRAGFLPGWLHRGGAASWRPRSISLGQAHSSPPSTSASRRARSPSARERSEPPGALPSLGRTAGGGGPRKDSRFPSSSPSPWERRASRGGTKAKPSGEGGPRCRGRRAVGRGPAGPGSPFCSLAGHFPRGSRGCRSGCGAAAGWAPSAAREVRAKYSPSRSSLGRGWSWSLLRGWGLALTGQGAAWVGDRRRAQSELRVPQHTATGGAPGRGVGRSGVRVGIPRARGAVCSENMLRYPSCWLHCQRLGIA